MTPSSATADIITLAIARAILVDRVDMTLSIEPGSTPDYFTGCESEVWEGSYGTLRFDSEGGKVILFGNFEVEYLLGVLDSLAPDVTDKLSRRVSIPGRRLSAAQEPGNHEVKISGGEIYFNGLPYCAA